MCVRERQKEIELPVLIPNMCWIVVRYVAFSEPLALFAAGGGDLTAVGRASLR